MFSNEFKDKRVDKMLKKEKHHFSLIFYSPIKVYLFFLGLLLIGGFPILWFGLYFVWTNYKWALVIYIIFGYLFAAYLNNSIVISSKKIIMVNPNFPFRRIKVFNITAIRKVKIASDSHLKFIYIFGFLGTNYIEVELSNEKKYRFYCAGLEIDCYDENQTELTLDDLHDALENRSVSVDFELGLNTNPPFPNLKK